MLDRDNGVSKKIKKYFILRMRNVNLSKMGDSTVLIYLILLSHTSYDFNQLVLLNLKLPKLCYTISRVLHFFF